MKTFEQLWVELAERAASRPEGSSTVAALDAGVHAIGKKVVEEAAEAWMAAEHEGKRARRRGDRPAALPRAGAHGRLRPHASTTSTRLTALPTAESGLLRIAVPNKGSLAEPASAMLREAGYRQRTDVRELVLQDPDNGTEFFFLRPRDIAVYVGSGQLDVGITGRDLLLDSGAPADEILPLGFAQSTFRFAARPGAASSITDLTGLRVATAYPGLVAEAPG